MKTCLVTGGTGFIGQHLLRRLAAQGVTCHYTTRGTVLGGNGLEACRPLVVDFSKDWDCSALPEQVDAVVHLAQSQKYRSFPEDAWDVFKVNIESTQKLLDYARHAGVSTFVYASSGGIYGGGEAPFDESFDRMVDMGDLGYYLSSKLCSEVLLNQYKSFFCVSLMRLFFVYGPGQEKDKLIARLFERVKTGIPITLNSQDGIALNPIFIEDAVHAICRLLERPVSGPLNVAGPDQVTLREIAEMMGRLLGKTPQFVQVEGSGVNLLGDIAKLRREVWDPEVAMEEGLRRMLGQDGL